MGDDQGGYMQTTGTAADRKKAPKTITPVTVKQLQAISPESDPFMLNGQELGFVRLVGTILSAQHGQDDHFDFSLDDGTGVIEARIWFDPSADETSKKDYNASMKHEWKENTYVTVHGNLKAIRNTELRLGATSVRVVTDMNELTYHMLDVIACANGPVAPSHHFSETDDLPSRIIQLCKSAPTQGVGESSIVSTLTRNGSTTEYEVKQAIQGLLDNVTIFVTITKADERFFSFFQ